MATVIDTLKARPRHPEKQKRPDTPLLRKPDWLRVRAPGSPASWHRPLIQWPSPAGSRPR
jgi:hypothetical protein